jgi:1,4-dihydroxy-2-naphthoate octaprenyltransferase
MADPKITLASAAPLFVGTAAAARAGPLDLPWLAATVAGIFCLEIAKNASGEIVDFDSGADQAVSGADRSPFSGGKRVLVDRLLTRGETAGIAVAFYCLAAILGMAIAMFHEPRVLWLGVAGAAAAYFYHAPPLRLSYRGLGEFAVLVVYGPAITCGAYLVQRGTVGLDALLPSLPLGALIAAFLWINEFPDFAADRGAGKRTLVVRLGRPAASQAFAGILAAAFAGLALLPAAGLPREVWLGMAGLPFAVAAARRVLAEPQNTARIVAAQGWTLLAFLACAAGAGLGLLIAAPGP